MPINPLLQQYLAQGYLPSVSLFGLPNPIAPPPVNDPGAEWIFGSSLDWAGRLIQQATGMDLETYMQESVCNRLSITDMTFKLQRRPDLVARRADYTQRNEDGNLRYDDTIYFREDPDECYGGYGIFASPVSYMKLLYSLLRNDGVLLEPETVHLMFQPALNERIEKQMNIHMDETATLINYGGPMPTVGLRRNFGLAGIIAMEDLDGDKWRRKGSITLGGGPNIVWVSALVGKIVEIACLDAPRALTPSSRSILPLVYAP